MYDEGLNRLKEGKSWREEKWKEEEKKSRW
jgi:hypothetical protein